MVVFPWRSLLRSLSASQVSKQVEKYGRWSGMRFEVADATLLLREGNGTFDAVVDKVSDAASWCHVMPHH